RRCDRAFGEVVGYSALDPEALRGRAVLDVAAGVGSFCAEGCARGLNVTAFDRIYDQAWEAIRQRCEPDLDQVMASIGRLPTYKWDFYRSPENLRRLREHAYRTFLDDYGAHRGTRYVAGSRPALPFPPRQLDLTPA